MKTLLFFFDSKCMGSKCMAYTCANSQVQHVIEWQTKLHLNELKEGFRTGNLRIEIVDIFKFSTYNV